MNGDAPELWLFARYPIAVVVVGSAAADMADYSGKSGNFSVKAQIASAGRVYSNAPLTHTHAHMSGMANVCGLSSPWWSVSACTCVNK